MNGFDIEIKYSDKAKTTSIEVWPGDVIKVLAPTGTSEEFVQKTIRAKARWIVEKSRLVKDAPIWRSRELVSGESMPFLGKDFRLKIIEGYGEVVQRDDFLIVPVPRCSTEDRADVIKHLLMKWYKAEAKPKIESRVLHFCEKLNVSCNKITLKDMTTKWGTCSPDGSLTFNWQIITLSRSLFDLVIAHEVCHLKEMNHSSTFKNLLSFLIPDAEEREHHLKYQKNVF
jgi:predicted metal-dependent hydrolase